MTKKAVSQKNKKTSTKPSSKVSAKKTSQKVKKMAAPSRIKSSSSVRAPRRKSQKKAAPLLFVAAVCGAVLFAISVYGAQKVEPQMSLVSSRPVVKVGEPFTVKVYSNSGNVVVNAVGASVTYPEGNITLTEVNSKSSDYPVQAVQKEQKDSVEVVRAVIGGTEGKQLVTELTFVAENKGKHVVSFDPEATNLVDAKNNNNILKESQFTSLTIEAQE